MVINWCTLAKLLPRYHLCTCHIYIKKSWFCQKFYHHNWRVRVDDRTKNKLLHLFTVSYWNNQYPRNLNIRPHLCWWLLKLSLSFSRRHHCSQILFLDSFTIIVFNSGRHQHFHLWESVYPWIAKRLKLNSKSSLNCLGHIEKTTKNWSLWLIDHLWTG